MTPRQRTVLEKLIEGKDYVEIASDMGCSRSRVYQLARQAIRHEARFNCRTTNAVIYPRIAAWMQENTCTQMELSRKTGIGLATLRNFLNGHTKRPSYEIATKIAQTTGLNMDTLLEKRHEHSDF